MTDPHVAQSADGAHRVSYLRWVDRFSVLLAAGGGVAAAVLMLNIVVDVIGRYFFGSSLQGTFDLTVYAWMPTLVSLGLGYALLRGEHVRVNLMTAPLGIRMQRVIEVIGMAFVLGTTGLFIWYGIDKAGQAMALGEAATGTVWLQIWPFRWVVVLGMVGLFLQASAQLVRAVLDDDFHPNSDEAAAALDAEKTTFDELELSPVGSDTATGEATTDGKAKR